MAKPLIWETLLIATTLSAGTALAQEAQDASATAEGGEKEDVSEEGIDVAMPGITVTAYRERNIQRATTEVISVLSTDDIARTGEGDIAGALSRVTGLSVVGNGFVYVRGLGDRYSLALLNGSPLPSPEPMRRAIPLDLFPTNVVASSLVQKTYSPTFTGEFGGGVINLTTISSPKTPFFSAGLSLSGDTETTDNLGYDYYGGKNDWTGYDSGLRDTPPALAAFFASGETMSSGNVDTNQIAQELVTPQNVLIQRIEVPANWSGNMSAGQGWTVGDNDSRIGLIGALGFSSHWRTRDNTEQTPGSADLSVIDKDYRRVGTDNRAVTNGMLGLSYEFGAGSKLRWTNFYVHDTLKHSTLASGVQNNQSEGADFLEQTTAWYERQLLSTQVTADIRLDSWTLGGRASFSKSQRDAPYELSLGYERSNQAASEFGDTLLNRLDNGQTGYASAAFSELEEELVSAGVDITREFTDSFKATLGFDYSDTQRDSTRREMQIVA